MNRETRPDSITPIIVAAFGLYGLGGMAVKYWPMVKLNLLEKAGLIFVALIWLVCLATLIHKRTKNR